MISSACSIAAGSRPLDAIASIVVAVLFILALVLGTTAIKAGKVLRALVMASVIALVVIAAAYGLLFAAGLLIAINAGVR